ARARPPGSSPRAPRPGCRRLGARAGSRASLPRLLARQQSKADASNRAQLHVAPADALELAPQIADVHVEHVGVGIVVGAPHVLEQVSARHDLASMTKQLGGERELA